MGGGGVPARDARNKLRPGGSRLRASVRHRFVGLIHHKLRRTSRKRRRFVESAYRLFCCARCGRLAGICAECDWGQRYCSVDCRDAARLAQTRRAERLYQRGLRGRLKHAARQQRYRQAKKVGQKVTDQAVTEAASTKTSAILAGTEVPSSKETTREEVRPSVPQPIVGTPRRHFDLRCCVCGAPLPRFAVRHRPRRSFHRSVRCPRLPQGPP
jgi:hypothetical protein